MRWADGEHMKTSEPDRLPAIILMLAICGYVYFICAEWYDTEHKMVKSIRQRAETDAKGKSIQNTCAIDRQRVDQYEKKW